MAKEYRSKTRILFDLLVAVKEEQPAGTTRLLYRANLSNDRLKEYLGELAQKGWIRSEEEGARTLWRLTAEGQEVLTELHRVSRMMQDFGLGL